MINSIDLLINHYLSLKPGELNIASMVKVMHNVEAQKKPDTLAALGHINQVLQNESISTMD